MLKRKRRILLLFSLLLAIASGVAYFYLPLRPTIEGLRSGREKIASARWDATPLAPGVDYLHEQFFHLFGSPQNVHVLRIDPSLSDAALRIVARDNALALTSVFGEEAAALAAVNGTMFTRDKMHPLFFLRSGGVDMHPVLEPDWPQKAAFAVRASGEAFIADRPEGGWAQIDAPDVMVCWPRLLRAGRRVDLDEALFAWRRHPRTAVGLDAQGVVYFVLVDGRTSGSMGLSFVELQYLIEGLGLVEAINLDGGGSSTMWIASQGVVNRPSDNHRFDREGERAVQNAWVLLPK